MLYNSGAYAVEAGVAGAFGLAILLGGALTRWIGWIGLGAAALLIVNMTALFTGMSDSATLPGNVAIMLFIASASVAIWRSATVAAKSATSDVPARSSSTAIAGF